MAAHCRQESEPCREFGRSGEETLKVHISNSPHCTACPHQGLEAANDGAKIRTSSLPPTSTREKERGGEYREKGDRQEDMACSDKSRWRSLIRAVTRLLEPLCVCVCVCVFETVCV